MKDHVLALDQGTTSSRALVFDRQGRAVALAQRELPQVFPRDGWVEHDPEEIWSGQLACAREALAKAGLAASRIAAIGITNQRETTVLWERASGRALHPAIVWQDRRTAPACEELRRRGLQSAVRRRTGLLLDPYFSATKIAWLLENVAGARARADAGELAFGTVDTWLAWKLTGGAVHATDPSNASRTLLLDLDRRDWDGELLGWFGIPRTLLPRIVPSSGILGETRADWFGEPIPLAALAGDQQSAAFGQACFTPGLAKNTYGTGCFLLLHAGETRPALVGRGLLETAACTRSAVRGAVFLEGAVFSGGSTVQWLRDGLGLVKEAGDIEALAREAPDSGGVVLVPAFTGLGAPDWDPHARGTMAGITRSTSAAQVARAALEAIALQSAQLLQAMQGGEAPLAELRVDGGAARNDLLMQMQADLLGVPVVRPRFTETTAQGAAWLAGLATGFWSGEEELASLREVERRFEPQAGDAWRDALWSRWHRALALARDWAREPGVAADLPQRSRRAVWHPCTQMKAHERMPPVALARGEGAWLVDEGGRRILDGVSSWWVNLFGHANPRINAAITRQAGRLEHAMLAGFTHEPAVELAERLSALTVGALGHCFFASDGASSVEVALKMSHHYFRNRGEPQRREYIGIAGGYHGETIGALGVTDVPVFRDAYAPLLRAAHVAPSPDARRAGPGETAGDVARRAAQGLGELLERHGDRICAVILEPLVQCASGMAMHDPAYLRAVRSLCDRHGVHLIADEIAVGFGRTGRFFACEHAAVQPDLLCLSKGITGGYLPLAVTLAREAIYAAFYDEEVARGFLHSHSYSGSALACAAAIETLDIFRDEDVLAGNEIRSARLARDLAPLRDDPRVEHLRQQGMILAFDVKGADRPGEVPFPRRYFEAALRHGALIRPIGRTVYLMPPYVLTAQESAHLARAAMAALEESAARSGP